MPFSLKIRKIIADNYTENLPYILVGIMSGTVCCLYAMLFNYFEHQAQKLFVHYEMAPFLVSPVFLLISFLVVSKLAPGAAGSGIPQVMTCIEPEHRELSSKFLNLRIIVAKIVSSVAAIFGGAAIGREGPSLQISASIGALVSSEVKKRNFAIKSEQLLIAGAASGLAAAFNTPVGGIIYAIEELSLEHVRSYKTVLLLSVLIAGLIAQLLLGNYLYLGYPKVYNKIEIFALGSVILVAFMSGIFGAIFSELLIWCSTWRKNKSFNSQVLIVIVVGLIIAGSSYAFGLRFIFSGKESINHVLFNQDVIGVGEMLSRFFGPILSSMTGIAGGIFAPSLSAGATIGGIAANLIGHPEIKTLLGLTGMIGFLTGVTRTPITAFVLVQEMTDRHSAIFPMMLAAFFSSIGASIVSKESFYEHVARELKSVSQN